MSGGRCELGTASVECYSLLPVVSTAGARRGRRERCYGASLADGVAPGMFREVLRHGD